MAGGLATEKKSFCLGVTQIQTSESGYGLGYSSSLNTGVVTLELRGSMKTRAILVVLLIQVFLGIGTEPR
jgi:hypothetical protein